MDSSRVKLVVWKKLNKFSLIFHRLIKSVMHQWVSSAIDFTSTTLTFLSLFISLFSSCLWHQWNGRESSRTFPSNSTIVAYRLHLCLCSQCMFACRTGRSSSFDLHQHRSENRKTLRRNGTCQVTYLFCSICQRWLWCLLFSWRWIVWVEDHCSMKHNSWSINMNCIIHLHLSCTVSMLSARTTLDASKESASESVDRREISLRWVGFENMETVLSMIEMGEWMNCFRCSGITLSCKESEK